MLPQRLSLGNDLAKAFGEMGLVLFTDAVEEGNWVKKVPRK